MIHRVFRLAAWLALAAIVFVTVSPIGLRPHDVLSVGVDRALAFGVLGALFTLAYPRRWMFVGVAIVAGAFGIEWLQQISPTRHARFDDAVVKSVGALLGITIGWMVNTVLARRRRISIETN